MNVFVFDIETVPDIEAGRKQLSLGENIPDKAVADAMMSLAKEAQGSAFVKLHWQKIITISVVFRHQDSLKIWSLGEPSHPADEADLIRRFYAGLEKYMPTLVSWNGSGFDLPVLHYRALRHGIESKHYWEAGESNPSFKYNNYLNRYHTRHVDLMDVLAGFQSKANAKLTDIANLIGLPGKLEMTGEGVFEHYFRGEIEKIRNYCEIDVLNTYLIYLKFQRIRGLLSVSEYEKEIALTQSTLEASGHSHFQQFLSLWNQDSERA